MAYRHNDTLHNHKVRATKVRRIAVVFVVIGLICFSIIGTDLILSKISSGKTVVSKETNATVQSARINVMQTPFFRFQASQNWREVTDELNLVNQEGTNQYLYRFFDKNFIEHEIWITVNLNPEYKLEQYNVPTRVQPIRIEDDKSLTMINSVSEPCSSVIPAEDKDRAKRTVVQDEVSYFCDPGINQYTVTVGVQGEDNILETTSSSGKTNSVTITYRNVTAYPDTTEFDKILSTFKFL